MKVKINTKEKFHVITIEEDILAANMTEKLNQTMLPFLNDAIKNIIINLEEIKEMDLSVANTFIDIKKTFYNQNSSFVICNVQSGVKTFLEKNNLLEDINLTPTESEAWDIVQMEEIEREFTNF